MKVYLAGPMSGIPQFNFPAFFAAAEQLRADGFEVVSPAEIDNEEDKGAALRSPDGQSVKRTDGVSKTWGDFLARDVKLLADTGIQGIVFLPNWQNSKGAKLEAFVGLLQGFKFWEYEDGEDGAALRITSRSVIDAISDAIRPNLKDSV
jgi:hypothetical protein